MPDKNSVLQLTRWRQKEIISAHHLNQMVSAINFLLKTVGYLHNRTALANYDVPEASATSNYPGIIEKVTVSAEVTTPRISYGNLILPPFSTDTSNTITAVKYDYTGSTDPSIKDGTLYLNLASQYYPGALRDVSITDLSWSEPKLLNGTLYLPLARYLPSSAPLPQAIGLAKRIAYDPAATEPTTVNGVFYLNPAADGRPGYIDNIDYSSTATSPAITAGKIVLNPAHYDPSDGTATQQPGYISGIETEEYDPSDASYATATKRKPRIEQGKIILPQPKTTDSNLTIEYVSAADNSAAPGKDDWVQTLYLYGLKTGQMDYEYLTRQLMRIKDNKLQITQQISHDGNTWLDFY